jgi:hypothetical protein
MGLIPFNEELKALVLLARPRYQHAERTEGRETDDLELHETGSPQWKRGQDVVSFFGIGKTTPLSSGLKYHCSSFPPRYRRTVARTSSNSRGFNALEVAFSVNMPMARSRVVATAGTFSGGTTRAVD